jgi:hypothetical protein
MNEAKGVRARELAAKAAARVAKISAQNTEKSLKRPQPGKYKASRAFLSNPKHQRHLDSAAAVVAASEAAPAALPKVNCRGRTINLPHIYTTSLRSRARLMIAPKV